MILLLIFLVIFIVILLVGQFSRPANRRVKNHKRIRDNRRTAEADQSSMLLTIPTNEWWLHSNLHIPPGSTDHTVANDSASGNYVHDLPVAGVDSSVNSGGTDFSSGNDFGGFSGGGGDAGGGGAGGNW
jgi:uncharacterized membrane protein YgcG